MTPATAQGVPPPVPSYEPISEMPPGFICSVTQDGPLGTIGTQQSVSPDGVRETRLGSWATILASDGVAINASWDYPDPATYSLVQLSMSGLDPARSYRIQVQRDVPSGQGWLQLQGPLERPDGEGSLYVFTEWAQLTTMLTGAPDPRILVIRDDGTIIRSDHVDPAVFATALAAVAPLQPALDAQLADYRNLCRYYEGGPIAPTTQVPG